MKRLSLQIGYRDFKYGDPYFRCPVCGEHALYTGKNGRCTDCDLDFVSRRVLNRKLTPEAASYGALGVSLLLLAAYIWATGRGRPAP